MQAVVYTTAALLAYSGGLILLSGRAQSRSEFRKRNPSLSGVIALAVICAIRQSWYWTTV